MPWDGVFAGRTKRSLRLVNGEIQRQAIDTNIEEGANGGSQDKGNQVEKNGRVHAYRLAERSARRSMNQAIQMQLS